MHFLNSLLNWLLPHALASEKGECPLFWLQSFQCFAQCRMPSSETLPGIKENCATNAVQGDRRGEAEIHRRDPKL